MMYHLQAEPVQWQRISAPPEGGAVCFDMQVEMKVANGEMISLSEQGFMIRFQGRLLAWRNTCPHAGSPLDWIPGQFFSGDGKQLICHTHGAHFDPASGECLAGPCERGLYPLPIRKTASGIEVPLRMAAGQ